MSEKKPNIFDFATSELSQDAFIAWLLCWASPENSKLDPSLNELGELLLSKMIGIKADMIRSVEVGRQWENIDIWAEVNDDSFIVIEDKTGTTEHDNQLERYKTIAEDYYSGTRDNFYYIYLKTGNEPLSTQKAIENKGYRVITRATILNVLSTYSGNDSIVRDFINHLLRIENETNSFKINPLKDWSWYAWQGFYIELEKWYPDVHWEYVANPSGGFLGAWWHFVDSSTDDVKMYFQIEQGKFCFKIFCGDNISDTRNVRQMFYKILLAKAEIHNIGVVKPQRFGNGYSMTVGIVTTLFEYYDESQIKALFEVCCKVIDECIAEFDYENQIDSEGL